MWSLLPVHRPRIGISVSDHRVSLVELHRSWLRRPSVRRAEDRPIPPGLVHASTTEPNIVDIAALAQELRALLGSSRDRAVAVSLPDRAAHIALFAFESWPRQAGEREAILRWRFQQDVKATVGESRLIYQVFCAAGANAKTEEQAGRYQVLAAAIRCEILEQYEQVCEAAGLLPVSVGFSTLQLFELCRPVMNPADELFFVHQTSDVLAFLVIRHGRPVLLRVKERHQGQAADRNELIGTLQFYDDQYPHQGRSSESLAVPIYIVGDTDENEGRELHAPTTGGQEDIICPTANPSWTLRVTRMGWDRFAITNKSPVRSTAGLSALASVVAW